MKQAQVKLQARTRRAQRVRAKVTGTAARPRLSVFKSNTHIFAQIINDETGKTLASIHTKQLAKGAKTETATEAGKTLAVKAKTAGVTQVVFDRGGNRYHGRIKAVAEGARTGGLEF